MDRATLQKHIRLEAQKELARRSFWEYCKFRAGDFYNEDRPFLQDLAERLQAFVEQDESQIMVVNIPPRHGKTLTRSIIDKNVV